MSEQPILRIDPDSSTPVYRQVVDGIRSLLVEGSLAPGDALPTVRELGLDLGIHFNTVAEAYRMLAQEGWLDLRRRRGAVVLPRSMPRQKADSTEQFRQSLRQLIAQVRAEGLPTRIIVNEFQRLAKELSS